MAPPKPEPVSGEVLPAVPEHPISVSSFSPLAPVEEMLPALDEYDKRRAAWKDWIRSNLDQGLHYGTPKGIQKLTADNEIIDRNGEVVPRDVYRHTHSLYQAGAAHLCQLLMMKSEFSVDKDTWEQLGSKPGTVTMKCVLTNRGGPFFPWAQPGDALGEGRGAARVGEKGKNENTAIKMAMKSALVAAVRNALGIGDVFCQDLEDISPRSPVPGQDYTAPNVGTREEREAEEAEEAISLKALSAKYQKHSGKKDLKTFKQWASTVLETSDDLGKQSNWTHERIVKCMESLDEE